MTETNAKFTRLLAQRAHGSLGQLCDLVDRCSRFGMSSKFSDIGFRIRTTGDFLFGLLSQLLTPDFGKPVVAQEKCFATIRCSGSFFRVFLALTKTLVTRNPEMFGIL